jgi:hypothetical protein
MKKFTIIFLALLLIFTTTITARANEKIAVGGQLGFLASGAVVDIPLGSLALQAGLNYPLGLRYINEVTGDSEEFNDLLGAFFVVSADITYPISLGTNFDIKIGVSALGFTDFQEGVLGAAGVAIKGEYWLEEKDVGLFVNLNAPVVLFAMASGNIDTITHPLLPLIGLVSSTAGVLWRL